MVVQASTQPTEANAAAHAPSEPKASSVSVQRKSMQRKRRTLPRITLPLAIFAVAATFSSRVVAEKVGLAPKVNTPASLEKAIFFSSLDDSEPVVAAAVSMPATDGIPVFKVKRRASDSDTSSSAVKGESGVEDVNASTVSKASSERPTATSDGGSSPLPSPFDSLVPSAFQIPGGGRSCPEFMTNLLSHPTFKSCYPISMLIQTSTGFFNARKQLVSIVKVLDATCAADVTACTDFLSKAAQNLTSEVNCKREFEQNQTQVLLAYRGLRAYKVLYSATCLQDDTSNSYCYANAVTNLSTPSDAYLYFMPYGMSLPGASRPTCSRCTQKTMSIYHSAAADRRQLVASKYEDAAQQVNTLCGPNFVNSSLPAAENGALSTQAPSFFALIRNTLLALLLLACFL
ncbi:hypothetical protein EsDP_00001072 [Epichloe bromicola]|uniref:DUF7729 domain-containing protein n=1 Tax=Epichloe bromicola TaxID=79588 RepID=A0ABQ0CGR5_9HYPO